MLYQRSLFINFLTCGLLFGSLWAERNSLYGPTGLISIPTAEKVVEQEETMAAWYSFSSNDSHFGFSASLSVADTLEFSAFNDLGSSIRDGSSGILSLKYTPDSRFATGYMHDMHRRHRDILYGVYGKPEQGVYIGGGITLGNESLAVLGNYSATTKSVNRTFFMAGARIELSEIKPGLEGLMEFNGETTNFGLSYKPENFVQLQLDYFTRGDWLNEDRYVVSSNLKF
jgi:hypothetical protein